MRTTSSSIAHRNKQHHRPKSEYSGSILRLKYRFYVLLGVLILAGIAMVMRIETPVVWTFLYGIGGWAALTTSSTRKN